MILFLTRWQAGKLRQMGLAPALKRTTFSVSRN
jgi:hypothetical protein